ncbi:MAG TPA: M90 family metallopeptidase [Acidimicrobiia bacterium]|nr:M90 family metallopeptidase [Acidimicrobiia bacterium]
MPDNWEPIIEKSFSAWVQFGAEEHDGLAAIADWLLKHKHWEPSNGFELNDKIRVTVAIEAAVLILGLGTDYYREVSAIVVYPTTVMSRGTYAGPAMGTVSDSVIPVLGQAHDRRGPVIIAWDEARASARNPGRGRNVVFHEFAHKLDMLDDMTDGTPPLPKDQLPCWIEVCTEVYESLRGGVPRPPVDDYGATNVAEFFAVATESFFDVPVSLKQHEPRLYEVLSDFYQQNPADRAGV